MSAGNKLFLIQQKLLSTVPCDTVGNPGNILTKLRFDFSPAQRYPEINSYFCGTIKDVKSR